jgi:hypothetical protein
MDDAAGGVERGTERPATEAGAGSSDAARDGWLCERPFGGSREPHGRRIRRIFAASLDFATHFSA